MDIYNYNKNINIITTPNGAYHFVCNNCLKERKRNEIKNKIPR